MTAIANTFDFAVIGAGIAGASVAAKLAEHASVVLIEMESQAGYHSTGRSAAMFIPSYGPRPIQAFTRASAAFFENPPEEFGTTPLLSPRSELLIGREDQLLALSNFYSESTNHDNLKQLNAEEVQQHCPILKQGYAAAGVLDTSGSDINVHALHQGYLKLFKNGGGQTALKTTVQSLTRKNNAWNIQTNTETYQANVVINAAGAWAEAVGNLANAEAIGLIPKRRTALTIDIPRFAEFNSMPLVADISEAFYIKPEAGALLISPANEDPTAPCDVQPEELDIAVCIDQVENAFNIKADKIISKWAGLRSFVTDNSPVAGFSTVAKNFFWLAGQGGYGIQSSDGLSSYAAALALGHSIPETIIQHGLVEEDVSVNRLL